VLIIIIVLRKRIGLVVKLFEEAQKVLTDITTLFSLPIMTFIINILFIVIWSLIAMMIYSFGEYDDQTINILDFSFNKKKISYFMWAYHIIGLIWIIEFINACQAIVVSGTVVKWYFKRYVNYSCLINNIIIKIFFLITFLTIATNLNLYVLLPNQYPV
jgi:solute carrier family 44 protein 1 (choline transporter-like protein)